MNKHWTETKGNYEYFVTTDFLDRVREEISSKNITRKELAKKLKVSESRVSQLLNENSSNLTIGTVIKIARAVGLHLSLVLYEGSTPLSGNLFERKQTHGF